MSPCAAKNHFPIFTISQLANACQQQQQQQSASQYQQQQSHIIICLHTTNCKSPHLLVRLSDVCLQLFASSGLETADFANMEELSNHMGLFLQVSRCQSLYLIKSTR